MDEATTIRIIETYSFNPNSEPTMDEGARIELIETYLFKHHAWSEVRTALYQSVTTSGELSRLARFKEGKHGDRAAKLIRVMAELDIRAQYGVLDGPRHDPETERWIVPDPEILKWWTEEKYTNLDVARLPPWVGGEPLRAQVERACQEPTLIKAIAYICRWESERVVKETHENLTSGHRNPDGSAWHTFFERCIEAVWANWDHEEGDRE